MVIDGIQIPILLTSREFRTAMMILDSHSTKGLRPSVAAEFSLKFRAFALHHSWILLSTCPYVGAANSASSPRKHESSHAIPIHQKLTHHEALGLPNDVFPAEKHPLTLKAQEISVMHVNYVGGMMFRANKRGCGPELWFEPRVNRSRKSCGGFYWVEYINPQLNHITM
jgi:hypothetical protein